MTYKIKIAKGKKITYSKKFLGYTEGWFSIVINTILFALKLWAGLRIGSIAMVADAWHTISDSLTSAVVIIGFWIASKPADERHAFGHGRAECICSIIIGTLLGVVGVNFLKDSILRLTQHKSVTFELFAIIVFLISVFIKEALAQFSMWAGKRTNSKSLIADGWHHRSDAIASGLIVIGALFGKYFWWVDGILGIGVSLLILFAAYTIIRSGASALLGESPSRSLENKISETIRSADLPLDNIHHLHVHDYGEHMEITVHIQVPGDMNVDEAHSVASKVEKTLKDQFKAEITVHVEPAAKAKE